MSFYFGKKLSKSCVNHIFCWFFYLLLGNKPPHVWHIEDFRMSPFFLKMVPGKVVKPAMVSQLNHGGVNPRVASAAILPRLEQVAIVSPRYLSTDPVASHLIEIGCGS